MIDDDYDLGRYELKYAVKVKHRDEILAIARDHATPDIYAKPLSNISGALGYTVHSLYFDTPELLDYTERLSEARIRSRLRIRTYGKLGEDSPLFLENKRKFNDRVIKHRINLCSADSWVASSPLCVMKERFLPVHLPMIRKSGLLSTTKSGQRRPQTPEMSLLIAPTPLFQMTS